MGSGELTYEEWRRDTQGVENRGIMQNRHTGREHRHKER